MLELYLPITIQNAHENKIPINMDYILILNYKQTTCMLKKMVSMLKPRQLKLNRVVMKRE